MSDINECYIEDDKDFLEFISTGTPRTVQIDASDLTPFETEHMKTYGVKTILYMPLNAKGISNGYIEVWESRKKRSFSDVEINLCKAIAEHAAVAVENAFLHNKLTEAEQRFKSITKNSPDHIMLLDTDFIICYLNYAPPGMTVEKIIGTPIYSYGREDQQERAKEILKEVLESAEPDIFETELNTPDQKTVFYECRVSAVISDGKTTGLVVSGRDISSRKEMEAQLEYFAMHDPLTGLPNRRSFELRIRETINLVSHQQLRLDIAILDLDNFKMINDTYGHSIGDHVLTELGKRLKDNMRESDFAARLGGDEFIILFVNDRNASFQKLHERLRLILDHPVKTQNYDIPVSASIGFSSFDGNEETDIDTIIKQADDFLYREKRRKKANL